MNDSVINSDPKILGGTPVFRGTRVPIKAIFDYLEAGDSLDDFLDNFPSVTRKQALTLLEMARASLTDAEAAGLLGGASSAELRRQALDQLPRQREGDEKPWMRYAGTIESDDSNASEKVDDVVHGRERP